MGANLRKCLLETGQKISRKSKVIKSQSQALKITLFNHPLFKYYVEKAIAYNRKHF